jgi:hypothetical protein
LNASILQVIVDYFLDADIEYSSQSIIKKACVLGNFKLAKGLLSSNRLKRVHELQSVNFILSTLKTWSPERSAFSAYLLARSSAPRGSEMRTCLRRAVQLRDWHLVAFAVFFCSSCSDSHCVSGPQLDKFPLSDTSCPHFESFLVEGDFVGSCLWLTASDHRVDNRRLKRWRQETTLPPRLRRSELRDELDKFDLSPPYARLPHRLALHFRLAALQTLSPTRNLEYFSFWLHLTELGTLLDADIFQAGGATPFPWSVVDIARIAKGIIEFQSGHALLQGTVLRRDFVPTEWAVHHMNILAFLLPRTMPEGPDGNAESLRLFLSAPFKPYEKLFYENELKSHPWAGDLLHLQILKILVELSKRLPLRARTELRQNSTINGPFVDFILEGKIGSWAAPKDAKRFIPPLIMAEIVGGSVRAVVDSYFEGDRRIISDLDVVDVSKFAMDRDVIDSLDTFWGTKSPLASCSYYPPVKTSEVINSILSDPKFIRLLAATGPSLEATGAARAA